MMMMRDQLADDAADHPVVVVMVMMVVIAMMVVMMVVAVMVMMIARHLHPIALPASSLVASLTGCRRVGCPQRSHRVRNRVKQFGK